MAAIPTVTINQAGGQADPTGNSPVNFTVVFSEAVTGFNNTDVTVTGTAGGTKVAAVTGTGPTYNVAVSGMTTDGTVVAMINAGAAKSVSTNEDSAASTSTDNTVNWVSAAPTVTVNQAAGQADPTGTSPIGFIVVFSEDVTGFATGDVTITGTAGGSKTGTVSGSGTTYAVAVTGMTSGGTVTATVPADVATGVGGKMNLTSTSTDNTVTWDVGQPSVTVNQSAGQADPTGATPISFTVVFSEDVTGFAASDVTISGTAGGTKTAAISGGPQTYTVAISGMSTAGTVIVSIGPNVATDGAGNPNTASTSSDNTVNWAPGGPTVTINQAATQPDPTSTAPINFTVVFSAAVTGFATGDVTITGTAGGTKVGTVTGSGTSYNVAVSGMTTGGTVIATIAAGVAVDGSSRPNLASTSTDNTVTLTAGPSVTINQAATQPDPTNISPINFTVVFSAAVTGFTTGDVTITGTSGGTKVGTVTGSGTTYNVAVTGMSTAGTVTATIGAGVALDGSSRPNLASTSTDNTVTWSAASALITVTPSASTITWGGTVVLTTRFSTNGANRTFQLWGARDNRNPANFALITTQTTNASGVATFAYTPPTNLFYEARFAGASGLGAATSAQARVVVRQIALLRPTNSGATKTVNRGTTITFTTTVRPSRPELTPATVTFWVFRRVSGVWQQYTSRNVTASSAGLALFTWSFSTSGSWYVRSMANPTPYNANSVKSPVELYNVN